MGRKQLTISMPEDLHRYVEDRVYYLGFGTVSEYFRQLVRHDLQRHLGQLSAESRYGQHGAKPFARRPLASAARRK
jgi:Arc/MetJ-type ribon-helix-helix transcriptional regulator